MKASAKCCSRINDNLYLGNQFSTSVITDVDAIVSIGCKSKSTLAHVNNFKISVKDSADSDISPYLTEASSFIHEQVLINKKVLVHCQGGINRSPTFVVAYLAKYHMSLDDAILTVTNKRPAVRIQPHYMEQVQQWLNTE